MGIYGTYDAQRAGNASPLFIYKETPVASTKMNRWNGNIEAGFDLLHTVCSALFTRGELAVIATNNADALRAVEADTPDMTIRVNPGWAIVETGFAGLADQSVLPNQGAFIAPTTHPRVDLVALSSSGELLIVEGDEAETPIAPTTPNNALALAQLYHRPGAGQILNEDNDAGSYLIDARPRFAHGDAHRHSIDAAPTEAPDGVRSEFSTQDYFRAGSLQVFLNGVLQKNGVDYYEDEGGKAYQFLAAPPATALLVHRYLIERIADV
ncbi:MAG: hypothetical protein P9L94_11530 [Candidatus Hinthialibacter antarcticus]|nr:hypothetical protein [Candidatus Hinthialibacter antarcticus]